MSFNFNELTFPFSAAADQYRRALSISDRCPFPFVAHIDCEYFFGIGREPPNVPAVDSLYEFNSSLPFELNF